MKIQAYLIGIRYLDFTTKDGDNIRGTQAFVVNSEIPNNQDHRIPDKIFVREKNLTKKVNEYLNKVDRDILPLVELDCSPSGNKIVYTDINVIIS